MTMHRNDAQLNALIQRTAMDLARYLMWTGRKEDTVLPPGSIGTAVARGVVTGDEIVAAFKAGLRAWGVESN